MRYIDTKDQAVMIRAALKKKYPGIKFSVRIKRYSGGSSVYVDWTDGPTQDEVWQFTRPYDGTRFDGMIDLSYAAHAWLQPDGTVTFAGTSGHSFDQEDDQPAPSPDAQRVHFLGRVSVSRTLSPELKARCAAEIRAATPDVTWTEGSPSPRYVDGLDYWAEGIEVNRDGEVYQSSDGGRAWLSQLAWRLAALTPTGA